MRSSQVPLLADTAGGMLDVIDARIRGCIPGGGSYRRRRTGNFELYPFRPSRRNGRKNIGEAYDIPLENLVVPGYGEAYLKINTQEAERQNRRVTIRNITPLLMTEVR